MRILLLLGGKCVVTSVLLSTLVAARVRAAEEKPNILWFTAEDMSCNLGCYGDAYATTPHLDRFAKQSVRYTHVRYRTGVLAGAVMLGHGRVCHVVGNPQNLRSRFPIPHQFKGFPAYLRAAGYYCSNNVKTDYNTGNEATIVNDSWDDCSATAHWRGRRGKQPFFSVFNSMLTHQSRTNVWSTDEFEKMIQSRLRPQERHEPGDVPIPPYYPDTPTVRKTLARYYDCISAMDKEVGHLLGELGKDGLADNTVVFFYSDHGAGIPRGKRVLHDSGLHVPLLIRFPANFRHLAPTDAGDSTDRLVSFVDFTPTVLSLAGVAVPGHMQGQVFLGPAATSPREYVFGARDRVDEVYELSRSVRDGRYLYIRNYMPHLSWKQPERYSDAAAMRREITQLAEAGKLNAAQLTYAGATKPREELYDSESNPYQIKNLAGSDQHHAILATMRAAQEKWLTDTRDLALLPEAIIWNRLQSRTPWDLARDKGAYPRNSLLAAAELVGRTDAVNRQTKLLVDGESGVRYWAAMGLRAAGVQAAAAHATLVKSLADPSPTVRIEAAAALATQGDSAVALPLLRKELAGTASDTVLHAARTLELMGEDARSALPDMKQALTRINGQNGKDPLLMFIRFSLEAAIEKLDARS